MAGIGLGAVSIPFFMHPTMLEAKALSARRALWSLGRFTKISSSVFITNLAWEQWSLTHLSPITVFKVKL